MSASNTLETSLLKIMFEASSDTAWTALLAASNLYISLHTADPGEAGSQTTSEAAYTGYDRVAVTRDTSGWTVSGGSVSNDAQITFGQCTANPVDITHVGLGLSPSGAGTLLLSNALNSTLTMAAGVTPIFSATQLAFTCD